MSTGARSPEVEARLAAYHAKRAAAESGKRGRRHLALLNVCMDGADDLDWAAIFASIDPEQCGQ